uniref:Uncharacterized protein n=1 Tax=Pithovirus LCPAC101 TaxID=2506586 RepID=A0A481Z2H6_9VIRU|nr:MAG: hypothetical protein LCPAC101_01890 [Pithovirus LCPAC101]
MLALLIDENYEYPEKYLSELVYYGIKYGDNRVDDGLQGDAGDLLRCIACTNGVAPVLFKQ